MSDGIDEIHTALGELEKLLAEASAEMKGKADALKKVIADRDGKIYDLEGLIKLRKWELVEIEKENTLYEGKVGKLESIEKEVDTINEMPKKDWVKIKELMDQLDDVIERVKPVKAALKQMHIDLQNRRSEDEEEEEE